MRRARKKKIKKRTEYRTIPAIFMILSNEDTSRFSVRLDLNFGTKIRLVMIPARSPDKNAIMLPKKKMPFNKFKYSNQLVNNI